LVFNSSTSGFHPDGARATRASRSKIHQPLRRVMNNKKNEQLGMNSGTAQHRLVKDTLFRLAVELGHVCFRCGLPLVRETFTVEHKKPWLDSENPKELFFDQNNVAFSHAFCNFSAARKPNKYQTEEKRRQARSRTQREYNAREYTPEKRRERYLATGN